MTHTDELLEPHEAELRDLLERTMSTTAAPTEIGPHALRQGRRLRTRRRIGIASATVAASAAVALVLPTALGGGSTKVVDPAGRPSSSASEPVQEAPVDVRPEGWWDMPAVDMISTVEAILPDGITITSPGPLTADTAEGGPAVGYIVPVVSGLVGPGQLNVMLDPVTASEPITLTPDPGSAEGGAYVVADDCDDPTLVDSPVPCTEVDAQDTEVVIPNGEDGEISCPGNLAPRAQCTELVSADGTLVGRRSSTTLGDVTTLEVVLRRDGGTVYAAAVNSLDLKPGRDAAASAETPPLTLDQLEALARNDTWVRPAT